MIAERFKVGDLVTRNSEAGRVSGTFIKVHTIDIDYKRHTRYASEVDPQYEIKSTRTDHVDA
jgi:Hypervirulence associated proteins TUDOR domain